jgi:hydrogenase-4 component F
VLILLLLTIPLFSALLLAFLGRRSVVASLVSIVASLFTFVCALLLAWQVSQQETILWAKQWFYLDHLSAFLIVLTSFIGFTTAIFSATYLVNERLHHKLTKKSLRFYHSLYQFFIFTMLLILTTNNLGILWVAMEGATLGTVLLVSLYRTPQSLEAAWKYLILCGVGIAQALLGTILLYYAAEKIMAMHNALFWTQLFAARHILAPHIASLAFIFLLVGYGTKVGFVPLHNWLPDAHGEGPAPVSALLSGLLLNMAFYAILRCKLIVDGATGSSFTNHFLLGFGLLNVLVGAFFLLKSREIKRLFAYSSIEHMGLIAFAFGLNTPLAIFAGLLHMSMHSLSKTAAFFSAGQAIQVRNTPLLDHIKGLVHDYPALAWGFLLSSIALMGIPPSALFTSEFLILLTTIKQQPWLTLFLFIGLAVAFAALLQKVQTIVFGEAPKIFPVEKERLSLAPIYLHVIMVLSAGLLIPAYLAGWFKQISLLMQGLT